MPPFRNPFGKKPQGANGTGPIIDENVRPSLGVQEHTPQSSYAGSRASSSMSIKKKEEPSEYKLSVVNDSGVYLPDISARSPVYPHETTSARGSTDARKSLDARGSLDTRGSLDSKFGRPGRPSKSDFERPEPTDEEAFEDVGLNDEIRQVPKKKGIFARFGDNSELPSTTGDAPRPTSSHRGFHLPGRKRGQSGQGAELGSIDRPIANGNDDGIVR
ncbi:hypothetical protein P7C71_g5691, partial [Lecanoromycetidae sp. Uapishka_2]